MWRTLTRLLLATLVASVVLTPAGADDTEIFSAPTGGTIGPNILLIIDNSGSMSSEVYTAGPFDPNGSYLVTSNQNPHTGYCNSLFDETKYYVVSGTGAPTPATGSGYPVATSIPACPTSSTSSTTVVIAQSNLQCNDAATSLATTGIATRNLQQWGKSSSSSSTYLWTNLLKNSTTYRSPALYCYEDYVAKTGTAYPASPPSGSTQTLNAPYTVTQPAQSNWTTQTLTPYTIYSGKYLNYYYFGAWGVGTRIGVVQTAADNLATNLSNVNIGLMTYNTGTDNGGVMQYAVSPMNATTRPQLIAKINALQPLSYTPLSDTLYEAYRYYAGLPPVFSKYAANSTTATWLSGANYLSPIQYSCQRNFVVFLTDGMPTFDDKVTNTYYPQLPSASTLGGSCDPATSSPYSLTGWGTSGNISPGVTGGSNDPNSGRCLSSMARYMFNADLNTSLPGQQNVQTYFIGFGDDPSLVTAFSYLQNAAAAGGGQAFTAADLSELQTALTTIVSNILQISTTFTAPAVAVNAFNRTQTLNDIYLSVFQPGANYHWPGNIKRYEMQNGTIVDANGQPAVDPTTGFFKSSAQSVWSTSADGASVPQGGAAALIPDWNPADTPHRNVYTYVGANPGSPVTLTANTNYQLSTANALLTNTLFGITSTGNTLLTNVINYALGEDLHDQNNNQSTTDTRHTMGDPLHSQPAAVTYGGTTAKPDVTDGVLYVAENDGFLHAISTQTGVELWSFVPQQVLPQLVQVYLNSPQSSKQYALDGSVRALVYDANGDGIIDPSAGDRVFIYFGQGRGGSTYYALDVTDRYNPKFMWSLGPGSLPGIGQAWSTPQIARIKVGGGTQTSKQNLVLVFAGGYDAAEETPTYSASDATGNALYLVDAVAGTVLWSGGGSNLAVTQTFGRMDHAIPSDVTPVDSNGDGFTDRLYVGDMAGQLWRFDIANGNSPQSLVTGGVIASLGAHDLTAPTLLDTRRFYNAPDVSVAQNPGHTAFMNIAIGSGYRGHPLSTATQERMYEVRDYTPFTPLTAAQYAALTPVRDSDLTDITGSVAPVMSATAAGWKLVFNPTGTSMTGEKVLVNATTLNNQVLFTTYTPGGNSPVGSCQPALGVNRFYAVSALNGSPVANLNNQNNQSVSDRSTLLAQTGIAPNIAFLFPAPTIPTNSQGNSVPGSTQSPVLCMAGAELLGSCKSYSSRIKTYWKETDAP